MQARGRVLQGRVIQCSISGTNQKSTRAGIFGAQGVAAGKQLSPAAVRGMISEGKNVNISVYAIAFSEGGLGTPGASGGGVQ